MRDWTNTTDYDGEEKADTPIREHALARHARSRALFGAPVTILIMPLAFSTMFNWFGWIGSIASALGWRLSIAVLLVASGQRLFQCRRSAALSALAATISLVPLLALSPRADFLSESPTERGLRLRIVLANVHSLNTKPDDAMAALIESDADVIVLSEPPPAIMHSLRPNEPLASVFPHIVRTRPVEGQHPWVVVASKHHLESLDGSGSGINPVMISIDEKRIGLIATRLISPRSPARQAEAWNQAGAVVQISESMYASELPFIIAGDLNATPTSHLSRSLASATKTRRGKPRFSGGGTWPTGLPAILRFPIDDAFVSSEWRIEQWTVLDIPGSDHRGILIDLFLPASVQANDPSKTGD